MKKIQCPCCESVNTYEAWYEISNDSFYLCPTCQNTCTHEEIEPQLEDDGQENLFKGLHLLRFEKATAFIADGSFDYLSYMVEDHDAFVFIENNEVIGTACLLFNGEKKSVYIGKIDSVKEGVGYGRKMISYLQRLEHIETITGESAEVVQGFFSKMGAVFGEYDKCMEGYEFTIHCK